MATTNTGLASTKIVVNAQGTAAGGENAHFNVLLDGKAIGEGTAGTAARDFTFTTDAAAGRSHEVQVQYDNDTVVNGQDRTLTVNGITINGEDVSPSDDDVRYDKGALDGRDVAAGQADLWWNGTLVVDADESFFPTGTSGGDTPTPTPTPAPDPSPTPAPTGPAIYVATDGRDGWSGRLAAPNADGTDGPKATLNGAQEAMRADPDIDTTYVRGGEYHMSQMLWLESRDSGVSFAAYGDEKPVFDGAGQVSVMVGLGGAKNVTIEGLGFTGGRTDGHTVYANDASGLTFKDNTVEGGGYGITVERSADSHVTGNHFAGTGAEAVYVKVNSDNTEVSDNLVQRPNAAGRGDAGIWVNGSSDVTVTHNQIEDSPAKAIAVGSVETTGSDATYRATVTYNKVIGANLDTSDGGGIYLINRQQDLTGHTVANNEVTGTTASGGDPGAQVSWGIYLDDWTSGATVEGNLVHGNVGGVFLHGGWDNTVTNNVIADNSGAQIGLQQDVAWGGWKGRLMNGNEITENVVDVRDGTAVHIYGPGNVGEFHDNFYSQLSTTEDLFDVWPQVLAGGGKGNLGEWRAAGYDEGSVRLDPQFVAPEQDNYALDSDSPVYQQGFEPLPVDIIGLT